jgi:hypothetical protein
VCPYLIPASCSEIGPCSIVLGVGLILDRDLPGILDCHSSYSIRVCTVKGDDVCSVCFNPVFKDLHPCRPIVCVKIGHMEVLMILSDVTTPVGIAGRTTASPCPGRCEIRNDCKVVGGCDIGISRATDVSITTALNPSPAYMTDRVQAKDPLIPVKMRRIDRRGVTCQGADLSPGPHHTGA